MVETIITSVIGVIVSGVLGYCVSLIRNYKKKLEMKEIEHDTIKGALRTLLQSNLTNTYYAYEKIGRMPDYVYRNWLNELKEYEQLGGDDYIHTLAEKMKHWEFVVTDILER